MSEIPETRCLYFAPSLGSLVHAMFSRVWHVTLIFADNMIIEASYCDEMKIDKPERFKKDKNAKEKHRGGVLIESVDVFLLKICS